MYMYVRWCMLLCVYLCVCMLAAADTVPIRVSTVPDRAERRLQGRLFGDRG